MRFAFIIIGLLCFCNTLSFAQSEKWKVLEIEADTLMAHEDYEGAFSKYNEVAKLTNLRNPETYLVYYKRAVCLYSLQQFDEALDQVNQFLKLQPDFDQAKLLKAFIGRELGDTDAQISSLSDLLLRDPKNVDLLKWRSTTFVDAGFYPEARRDIVAAQKINNDAELEGYMGITYYYEDKPDSAILHFDKAIAMDKTYITAYLYAVSLCLDEEAYDLSLDYVYKGLQVDPANISLQFYKGIALVQKDDLKKGCSLLYKAFNAGIDDAGDYLKEFCYGVD